MAKKKTEEPAEEVKQRQPKTEKKSTVAQKASSQMEDAGVEKAEKDVKEQKQRRPAPVVTNSGDLVSHAHWYKSENDDQIYFTARVNNVPLIPRKMSPQDVEAFYEKRMDLNDLFEKYYPTKVAPRFDDSAFKMPQKISTSEGELQVVKYNVYKNTQVDGKYDLGQWMLYAQVGDRKMSVPATQDDLDNYFDHTRTPREQIVKSFGDRLGLKEHYEQFKLPEGVNLSDSDIRLQKNKETNEYQLQVRVGDDGCFSKTLPYSDTKAFFDNKATKQQLVAKHLGNELSSMTMSVNNTQKQDVQKTRGIK
ncbi:MAG: hypothetical protein NC095_11700 [Muribaculum sp.]|nr:hypothetical protein [Muribaculum sp.]